MLSNQNEEDIIENFDSVRSSAGAIIWNIFIIVLCIIIAGLLFWYLNKQLAKSGTSNANANANIKKYF